MISCDIYELGGLSTARSWDEVKSVQKLCRFITSSFILQEKARSDGRISVIHSFSAGRGSLSRRHDSYDRYDGYFGMPRRCHPLRENTL